MRSQGSPLGEIHSALAGVTPRLNIPPGSRLCCTYTNYYSSLRFLEAHGSVSFVQVEWTVPYLQSAFHFQLIHILTSLSSVGVEPLSSSSVQESTNRSPHLRTYHSFFFFAVVASLRTINSEFLSFCLGFRQRLCEGSRSFPFRLILLLGLRRKPAPRSSRSNWFGTGPER